MAEWLNSPKIARSGERFFAPTSHRGQTQGSAPTIPESSYPANQPYSYLANQLSSY